jgi:hypothetical protein
MDEESFVRAEDGPRKVSVIVDAVERLPALAAWLRARRPNGVSACKQITWWNFIHSG